jgi:hypothetical protein
MRLQCQAIVDEGFVLQFDCPDLTLSRHTVCARIYALLPGMLL